ncbi:MAG: HAMP domain-containing protein [Clostridia bacterium]|nr:HAMP domain-containing protein [Clostridia bacterium]
MNAKRVKIPRLKEPKSIRTSILSSLLSLIVIMLIIMWFAQTVMLSYIYKYIKMNETENLAEDLTVVMSDSEIGESEFFLFAKDVSQKYETCIYAINISDGYSCYYECHTLTDCFVHTIKHDDKSNYGFYESWYEKASSNGGQYTYILSLDEFRNFNYSVNDVNLFTPQSNCIISIRLVENKYGEEIMLILNSSVEPVNATIRTLNLELMLISIIMLIIALIISFWSSKRLSSPITNMSASARALAKGNYKVKFEESGSIETVELAKTLNHTAQELSKLDTMQKELIANISHDLRTPLTIISGYSEFMRDCPSEITSENLQVIIDETARLSSLVNDLLNVSKLQSGNIPIKLQKINITSTVRSTISRYSQLIEHDGYNISFDYDCEVYVEADEIRILQVVYNLINNAINYTGDDKVVKVTQSVSNDIVRISVTDTGEGISDEDLPLIWDRYYKVDKVHSRAKVGTGLGLSIVKNILLLHNSRFGVSSELGKGSSFWFELHILGQTSIISNSDEEVALSDDDSNDQ